MSEFFEIFNPGARFQRQQRDLDKTYVMQQKKGGRGPLGIDLDAGTMVIKPRSGAGVSVDQADVDEDAAPLEHDPLQNDPLEADPVEHDSVEQPTTEL